MNGPHFATGNNISITLNGHDLSGFVNEVTYSQQTESIEVTSWGDINSSWVPGETWATMTVTCSWVVDPRPQFWEYEIE